MYCLQYRTECNLSCSRIDPENCKHLGTTDNVVKWAMINVESKNAGDFKKAVFVEHMDGSTYKFSHACYETLERFFIVYPEHGNPCVFYIDDLQTYPRV